jgi:transcriptional regulator with XRE-family HTH domain
VPVPAREFGRERYWLTARRLRERRLSLGLTQQDVVTQLAELGLTITDGALSHMENGRGIDIAKLPELAAVLDCTYTYLLGGTTDPRKWEPDKPLVPPHRVRQKNKSPVT